MKDEEMAEEIVKRNVCEDCNRCQSHGYIGCDIYRYSKDSFLAGLKAGRPQWHDLRKDPNDLPEKNGEYFCKVNSHWEKYGVKHFTLQPYGYNRQWEGQGYSVIAWCEIPTFDKE